MAIIHNDETKFEAVRIALTSCNHSGKMHLIWVLVFLRLQSGYRSFVQLTCH